MGINGCFRTNIETSIFLSKTSNILEYSRIYWSFEPDRGIIVSIINEHGGAVKLTSKTERQLEVFVAVWSGHRRLSIVGCGGPRSKRPSLKFGVPEIGGERWISAENFWSVAVTRWCDSAVNDNRARIEQRQFGQEFSPSWTTVLEGGISY